MNIRIYADGAPVDQVARLAALPHVAGFTTNPSLARKAGVANYRAFGKNMLVAASGKPVSIEVLADEPAEIERQAHVIASWGENAVVKIPVMTTDGTPSYRLIRRLAEDGVSLNVTAVFTEEQVREVGHALDHGNAPAIVSVFAGRIADAGFDPLGHVILCRAALRAACPRAPMLWASTRQAYDAVLAERARCEIITMTPDLIAKLALTGRDLTEYSRETVEMFYRDARAAGFEL